MLDRTIQINKKEVRVQQDLSLSHAGTVWDGALVLAYYLQKNQNIIKQYIQNKKILELGSGTGILGLTVALFNPSCIYLSDFKQFLPILQRNVKINEHNWKNGKQQCKVEVISLKWGCEQEMGNLGQIDTIIGSQLAYDVQNIGYLIKTFLYFLRQNDKLNIIISYQKYENPQRNLYVRLLKVQQLSCRQVDKVEMNQQYYDKGIGILIISKAQS